MVIWRPRQPVPAVFNYKRAASDNPRRLTLGLCEGREYPSELLSRPLVKLAVFHLSHRTRARRSHGRQGCGCMKD